MQFERNLLFKIRLFAAMAVTPSQNELEHLKDLPDRECQNCQFIYDGYFCPRCGQKYMDGRFTLKESVSWILGQILNLEKGFFHTIWQLIFKPGIVINDYLNKATVRYIHPFRFAFIVATISALITISSGAFETQELSQYLPNKTEKEVEMIENFIEEFKKYFTLIMLVFIPFYAFGTQLIYRRFKKNFTEHLILNCYAYGFSLVLAWPLIFIVLLPNGLIYHGTISFIVSLLAIAWVYAKFFKESVFKAFLKTILVTIFSMILGAIVGAIFSIVFFTIKSLIPS